MIDNFPKNLRRWVANGDHYTRVRRGQDRRASGAQRWQEREGEFFVQWAGLKFNGKLNQATCTLKRKETWILIAVLMHPCVIVWRENQD